MTGRPSVPELADRLHTPQWHARELLDELAADGFAERVAEDIYRPGPALTPAIVQALAGGIDLEDETEYVDHLERTKARARREAAEA